jgi:hypothetical protein
MIIVATRRLPAAATAASTLRGLANCDHGAGAHR